MRRAVPAPGHHPHRRGRHAVGGDPRRHVARPADLVERHRHQGVLLLTSGVATMSPRPWPSRTSAVGRL
ncbi:hypothetical protein FRIGORI9N_80050 [Frigoribacterium sp. 9N]|nr:hypothetical protein FRIGORI9N_80050 [Frigoribacterium sp. 9N]